jgi:2,4-dienoyl-CoA reductase-like NADH-dependent reductase (Old Yellow Enzyme family)
MKAAGLDGLELEAYGHLMDQFWSPLTNTLDAPYGGSLDNRMKFTFDVLTAMRKRVGPDFLLGIRYTADEMHRRRPHERGRAVHIEEAER